MRTTRLSREVEIFVAGVGAAQSLLMAAYSFYERKKDFRNTLLFIFFLAITLRLAKSILWVYLETTPVWLINIGFIAHAISGPALFLYVLHFLFPRKWVSWHLLHFLPGLGLLFFVQSLSLDGFWHVGGYSVLLFHQMGYSLGTLVVIALWFVLKSKRCPLGNPSLIWIISLILGTAVLQFLYFSNYILGITPYLLGPISYLPFVYFLAFLLFKNPSLLKQSAVKKHQNIRLETEELHEIAKQLELLMQHQKMYLDPDCTLTKVAKVAKLPPYLVSHVVNNTLQKSFSDFVNGYRIDAIKEQLLHPENGNIKISSIAYGCGFNTLSSFNIAFKKLTGTTPSKFQKDNSSL